MKAVTTIQFSSDLSQIQKELKLAKKEAFESDERIVIHQDVGDVYPYIDGPGDKLLKIQKIVLDLDISSCFILIETPNKDIELEIKDIAQNYSYDETHFDFKIIPGNYVKEIKRYSDTACKKLWNHLYIGTDNNVNPCCLADHRFPVSNIFSESIDDIYNSDNANAIRNAMIKGYRVRACRPCYEQEDAGVRSKRLEFNPSSTDEINVTSLDIRLNNICNFKCRMCSEYFSSSIQKETVLIYGKDAVLGVEANSLQPKTLNERQLALQKVLPYINTKTKVIYFAGGEPLIMEEHYKILQHLIDIKNTDLELTYNTNLSTLNYKNFNILNIWKNFSDVNIGISIDGSGKVAEYIRHGTVWNNIVENLELIKSYNNLNCKITSTVGFLNTANLIKLQSEWLESGYFTQDDLSVSVLRGDDLGINAIPLHHKLRLSEIILNHIKFLGNTNLSDQWKDVLKYMKNTDYNCSLSEFKTRMQTLDTFRDESFVDVFPEFEDLYR